MADQNEVAKTGGTALAIDASSIEALDAALENSLSIKCASSAFSQAFAVAAAIKQLDAALTAPMMVEIMALQGSRLGFRTDKDRDGGYPLDVVKRCLIEATLSGVLPVRNQFNIIASNCYLTKEGLAHVLNNTDGLRWSVKCGVPGVKKQSDGSYVAHVEVEVRWTYGSDSEETETLTFVIKGAVNRNGYHITTADAYCGKAIRKAENWLHNNLTGVELPEGDVSQPDFVADATATEVIEPAPEAINKVKAESIAKDEAEPVVELSPSEIISGYNRICEEIGRDVLLEYLQVREWLIEDGKTCADIDTAHRKAIVDRPNEFKAAVADWAKTMKDASE